MGLLDLIAPGNPVSPFLDQNRSNLVSGFAGMVGAGNDPRAALKGFAQGVQQNIPVQQRMQLEQQDRAEKQAQIDLQHQQQNATIAFLQKKYPDLAQAAQNGVPLANVYSEMWKRENGGGETTSDMRNFQFAQEHPEFAAFLKDGKGGSPLFGRTIYTGRDANGNIVPLQAGADGSLMQTQLPEGVTFDPGAMAGARAGATVDAKTAANARAALPNAEQTLSVTRQAIDNLRNDRQGQSEQFGNLGGLPFGIPNQMLPAFPGTPKANFQINVNQAAGQAFMQARQMLKGGGQITDYEGRRAEVAISKIEEAAARGDQKAFNDALDEFEAAVESGYQKLVAAAGGSYSTTPIPSIIGGGQQPAAGNAVGDPLGIR